MINTKNLFTPLNTKQQLKFISVLSCSVYGIAHLVLAFTIFWSAILGACLFLGGLLGIFILWLGKGEYENMKYWERILSILAITTIAILCFATIVLAAPGKVEWGVPNPTSTTIELTWTPSANTTVIYWRTDREPNAIGDGTLAYNGTGFYCTVSGLTAGTVYYFTAWGYDGTSYGTHSHTVMSTTPITLPTGAAESRTPVIPIPTVPSTANATANITGFNLEPFTSMIKYFVTDNATSPGGLGMPENNAWEVLAIIGIVMGGIGTYTKQKNFLIAYLVVLFLTIVFIGLHLVQWYLAPIELVIGLGVWAIERHFQ